MNGLPALYILQWGILFLYIFIYILIGLLRGAQKSLYFTLVNIVTTVLVIFLISNISVAYLLDKANIEFVDLINRVNSFTNNGLADYEAYLAEPEVQSTVFLFIDLALRIIGFFVFYPILKRVISFVIFRPIWSLGIKKGIIKRQNKKAKVKADKKQLYFKPRKRIKKSVGNRLLGGLFGAVNGFIVAFIVLIPITLAATYATTVDTTNLSSISNVDQLAVGSGTDFNINLIDEYMYELEQLNEKGLGILSRNIKVDGVAIDQYIFDQIFTVDGEIDGENVDVNFIQELENIIGISNVVLNGGYLADDFDYTQIDEDNLEDLEAIMNYLGDSDVLAFLIPTATKFGVETILADEIGMNLYDRDASKDALDMFMDINWDSELDRLYLLAESILTFGSVEELMAYMDDPKSLADLTVEESLALANILRSAGDLELLSLINVGVDYLTTLEDVQEQLEWLDPSDDKEAYLQDQLSFILDDPEYFIGEDGEISVLADLVELLYTDDYGNKNLNEIIDSNGDPSVVLEKLNVDWASAVLNQLTEIQLVMQAIPVAVDYGLYELGGDNIDQQLADDMAAALDDVNWSDEIDTYDNIFQSVLAIGLEEILADNPDYIAYVDLILENNLADVKDIVKYVFEDSQVVGSALDLAAPVIIDEFVSDAEIKEVIENIVLDDNEEFDFDVSQELNALLDIAGSISTFTSAQTLSNISSLSEEQILALVSDFGQMNTQNYNTLINALSSLQILQNMDSETAEILANKFNVSDHIYIPQTLALHEDVVSLIDLVHDVAVFYNNERVLGESYKTIDLTGVIDTVSTHLTDSEERSDLLFYNMAYYAKKYAENDSIDEYVEVPFNLRASAIESNAWETELENILDGIFGFATVVGETDGITLSINEVLKYRESLRGLPIELVTQFADETLVAEAFGGLDSSLIFRTSLVKAMDSQALNISDVLFGYEIETPAHLVTNGTLNENVFEDLIHGVGVFSSAMNESLKFEIFNDVTIEDLSIYMRAFNKLEKDEIEALFEADLIHGVVSDALQSELLQDEAISRLNNLQSIVTVPSDFLVVDEALLTDGVLNSGEIAQIFVAFQVLNFNSIDELTQPNVIEIINQLNTDDHKDEFFDANYIYVLLDRALQNEDLQTFGKDKLSDIIGQDLSTLDITIPQAMLGKVGEVEAVEEDRVPKAEFTKLFEAANQLDFSTTFGVSTITDIIDPSDENDGYSTIMASDLVYFYVSRILDHDAISNFVNDKLSTALSDESFAIDLSIPLDAQGTEGIELGYISRAELKNMANSLKVLNLDNFNNFNVNTVLNLAGATNYAQTGDDLDIFLSSVYIHDLLSQTLLSDAIVDLIGTGQFTSDDFDLASNAYDINNRLSQTEIHRIVVSLKTLGISDFNNLDIGIDTVTSLSQAEQQTILDSIYFYEVIDLMIAANDDSLTIPVDAYVSGGDYDGMITKTEIYALLSVFNIPEIGSDPQQINTETITTSVLNDVLDKNSLIINQMISDQIQVALSISSADIPQAYETVLAVDRLLVDEMKALLAVMDVMNISDLSTDIDVNDVSAANLEAIHLIGLGQGANNVYDSYVVHRLISEGIIETLSSVPSTAYMANNEDLLVDEVEAVIDAISILSNDPNTSLTDLSFDGDALTANTIEDLLDLGSLIIHRQIATGIIDANLAVSEAYAELGDFNYDNEAINSDLKESEMYAIIEAMNIMGITDLDATFDAENITVNNLTDLHYIGLGTDPVTDTFDSYIVHNMISDAMESSLDVPTDAYDAGYMKASEVQAVIDALGLLSSDVSTDTLTSIIPVTDETYTPTLIENLLDLNALTIYRLVAKGIISSGIQTTESYAIDGDENYDENAVNSDLKVSEMYGLAEAMTLLGVTDVTLVDDIDMSTVLGLSDADVDTILDNSNTITYYIIDDLVDPTDSLFAPDYVNDADGNIRIERTVLITYIKDNN